ncbi:GSCOCT00000050001.2-RA-CDS [Cotesia congregata]|uniref:CYP6JT2 n=1 Tax=Cotesia congregata TaxID=51543 RepID=A0A8J2MQ99_COTCN|nr:GSCOCT00000050001.2-RA-CDS [Cotesia congregata]CAG5100973.1 CYP6JT2 [Cotesia congregata]
MEFGIIEILIIITGIIFGVVYWSTLAHNHWKNLGVPGPKPIPLIGNMGPLLFGQMSFVDTCHKMYMEWKKEPYFGIFSAHVPVLIVTDMNLIRQILIKDFHIFPSRGVVLNDYDPLSHNLFNIYGHKWKVLRSKITPGFTIGKIKHMIKSMTECAGRFENYLFNQVGKGKVLECSSLAGKYTMDATIACAFGVNITSIYEDDNQFEVIAKQLFKASIWNLMKQMISVAAPGLYKFLGLRILSEEQSNFFINFIKQTMELRERENVVRDDIIDILIDMKKNQQDFDFESTDSFLASQAFVLFVAGYEAPSSTISFALYELALAPKVQDKVRTEIFEVLKTHNGQLSYEAINEMEYLKMVIYETLRRNPPGPLMVRKAAQDYKLPGSNVILPAATLISIPTYSIHHDEKYFPNPEFFEPERFKADRKPSMAYLPFSDGPKSCMGVKIAIYLSALGLISVLKNFRVSPSKFLEIPYKIKKTGFILSASGGVNLKFEPIMDVN